MDTLHQELRSTLEATEEEAWELVSACVKKIFEELRRARASAANATCDDNKVSRCATYLWALIQAHKVQREFVDARFRNHPLIAPVIVLHVLKNASNSGLTHQLNKKARGPHCWHGERDQRLEIGSEQEAGARRS